MPKPNQMYEDRVDALVKAVDGFASRQPFFTEAHRDQINRNIRDPLLRATDRKGVADAINTSMHELERWKSQAGIRDAWDGLIASVLAVEPVVSEPEVSVDPEPDQEAEDE